MNTEIIRPALIVGILLAAAGYAATKEWQGQADGLLVPVAQMETARVESPRAQSWQVEAEMVQPEQIFQD